MSTPYSASWLVLSQIPGQPPHILNPQSSGLSTEPQQAPFWSPFAVCGITTPQLLLALFWSLCRLLPNLIPYFSAQPMIWFCVQFLRRPLHVQRRRNKQIP